MKRIMPLVLLILFLAMPVAAQEYDYLQGLKRPRYGVAAEEHPPASAPKKKLESPQQQEQPGNKAFAGLFKGTVTVHYKGRMITTEASLTVAAGGNGTQSHFDYYILPEKGEFQQLDWKLDGMDVQRSVTISGHTVYVTDLIQYENGGGNSQIRTLVFSEDFSALTFLKTEFDDTVRDSATGHIIGRFLRVR
ncbi:hypothetical protein [Maridesulfovibrio sp. FT414]|uniref:hypothetical protein n=1 Tax=Maridesulfovibrio sp. FT414 TaxID=2979469 RepID=UPI003D800B41